MDPASIAAAYSGLKFAKDSITAAIEGKIELDSQAKVLAALEKLGEAQDTIFAMRDEMFNLQGECMRLKKELANNQSWGERFSSYKLIPTPGGAVVYVFQGTPEHFACPSCINNQKIEILQDNRTNSGKFRCVACKNEYAINPRKPSQSINYPPSNIF